MTCRLRPERKLSTLIANQLLTADETLAVADRLASFYKGLTPQRVSVSQLREQLLQRIDEAAGRLQAVAPMKVHRQIQRIRASQQTYVENAEMVLNARVSGGRVIDGHGNLRPEHIYLDGELQITDSVGHNPLDVLDDLGCLTVTCEMLNRRDVANAIMNEYYRLTHDSGFPHLEAFYKSLRLIELASAATHHPGDRWSATRGRRSNNATSYIALAQAYVDIFA